MTSAHFCAFDVSPFVVPGLISRATQIFLSFRLSCINFSRQYPAMLALVLLLIAVSYITFALADRLLLRSISWEEDSNLNWQDNVNMHTNIASLGRQP